MGEVVKRNFELDNLAEKVRQAYVFLDGAGFSRIDNFEVDKKVEEEFEKKSDRELFDNLRTVSQVAVLSDPMFYFALLRELEKRKLI